MTLKLKFALGSLLVGGAGALAVTLFSYHLVKSASVGMLEAKAVLMARQFNEKHAPAIRRKDEAALVSGLLELMRDPAVKYAMVLDTDGRVVAHTDVASVGVLRQDLAEQARRAHGAVLVTTVLADGAPVLDVMAKAVGQAQTAEAFFNPAEADAIGILHVGFALQPTLDFADRVFRGMRWIAAVTLAAMLVFALAFTRFLTRPLDRLLRAITEMQMGKLGGMVDVSSQDEIGRVGLAFNRMSGDLHKTIVSREDLRLEVVRRQLAESRLEKLNTAFLHFGPDPQVNINLLTALCGQVLGADCALYQHLRGGRLQTVGRWRAPEDFVPADRAEGHVCYDVIKRAEGEDVILIEDLPHTAYARTDPNVAKYGLKTYVGILVRFGGACVGSLCVFYRSPFSPSAEERRILGIVAAAVSVEENRAQAEQRLQDSLETTKAILERMPFGVVMVGKDERIRYANKAALRLLGAESPGQVLGEASSRFLSPTGGPGRGAEAAESEAATLKGGRIPILKSSLPVVFEGQEVLLETFVDIVARKKAEAEIRRAMELKTEFTSVVSHELRTPLTAIKEGIGIVYDGSAGEINAEQKDFLETAKRNVDRLARLINDVLDYQKLDAGRTEYDIGAHDANELAREVLESMRPLAKARGLELRADWDAALPAVPCDRDRVIQVLTNLINNAIKFTESGSITVRTRGEPDGVVFCVADTGIGIKPEDKAKLFLAFSQLATGKNRKMGSTGLGLAISRKIVEQHGGRIWVESGAGEGSVFSFRLPFQEARG